MSKKKQTPASAEPETSKKSVVIADIKISIQSAEKNVTVHLVDPAACAEAASGSVDGELLRDFVTLCEDILEGNDDASKLEITADNAEEVLSSKQPATADPVAGDGEPDDTHPVVDDLAS